MVDVIGRLGRYCKRLRCVDLRSSEIVVREKMEEIVKKNLEAIGEMIRDSLISKSQGRFEC